MSQHDILPSVPSDAFAADHLPDSSALFAPARVGRLALRNRLAVAPMTRVSASEHGLPSALMARYYQRFAEGGFGLIITEGLYTDLAYSQGYWFQPGMATALQAHAWQPITAKVRAAGAKIIAQLMHAGALSQGNPYRSETRAPSATQPAGQQMAFYRGTGAYPVPVAMDEMEIQDAVAGFAQAAVHAQEVGFDGVEIHGANGYLLDQFLSEGINMRSDGYGGSLSARLRLISEVVHAVRKAVGADFNVGLRLSQGKVNNFTHKWSGGAAEAATIFQTVGSLSLDYLHITEYEAWKPAFTEGASLAALAKQHIPAHVSLIANGSLHDSERASAMLTSGEADAIALGRGALAHADWPDRLQAGLPLAAFDGGMLTPIADLEHAERYQKMKTQESR